MPLTCQLGWLFGITPSLRSFPFFFVHLFNFFFFNSTTNFLINWIACQMGREREEGFWASSPRDLSNAPTTWSTTPARTRGACKGSFFHSSVLPPLEVIKIKSCVKRPQVGVLRVAQCYRWDRDGRADLFCMSKRGEKLSAKICIATQKKKKQKKKKIIITRTRNVELQLLFVTGLGRREMVVGGGKQGRLEGLRSCRQQHKVPF